MQFFALNVAKVELDSTSATVARNDARKVAPDVRDFMITVECYEVSFSSLLLYKTDRFHFAVRLLSYRSQKTSKCGKNKSDIFLHGKMDSIC